MSEPHDEFKDLHRKVFVQGQHAVAQGIAADQFKERAEATQEAIRLASDTIDLANQMAKDGDPHKQLLAGLIKDSIAGAVVQVASGAAPVTGGRGAAEASPFDRSLTSSPTSGPSSPSSPAAKALPSQPSKPTPKKRGRPPGTKNGPKS